MDTAARTNNSVRLALQREANISDAAYTYAEFKNDVGVALVNRFGPPPAVVRGDKAYKVVYLVVRQTLTTATVRLLSDESTSEQVAGGVATGESGYPTIAYLYRNKPGIGLRHAISNIQYGGALIEIVGDPATGPDGEYWTDRNTKGSLAFREHAPTIAQTHEEAGKLSYGAPRPLRVLE